MLQIPTREADYRRLAICVREVTADGRMAIAGKDRLGRTIVTVVLSKKANALWRGPVSLQDREKVVKMIIETVDKPWTIL